MNIWSSPNTTEFSSIELRKIFNVNETEWIQFLDLFFLVVNQETHPFWNLPLNSNQLIQLTDWINKSGYYKQNLISVDSSGSLFFQNQRLLWTEL